LRATMQEQLLKREIDSSSEASLRRARISNCHIERSVAAIIHV
jgi:hypothetical protein